MTTFREKLASSHVVATRVDVIGSSGTTTVYPTDGSVSVDARRSVRRSASLTFVDYDGTLTPKNADALLAPFANEIRIYRGIAEIDGSTSYYPLGVFQIVDTTISANENGVHISVSCEDRARAVADSKWRKSKVLTAGANIGTALVDLLTSASLFPAADTSGVQSTTFTVPTTHTITLGSGPSLNPWTDLQTVALAAGWEIWWGADGIFYADVHPGLDVTETVATYAAGDNSTLLGLERRLTLDGISNVVSVVAEGSGIAKVTATDGTLNVPPRGEASDTDPSSPTNTEQIGERMIELSSPMFGTNAQGAEIARLILPQYIGQPITFEIVPDPSLDVRDIVRVTDDRIGLDTTVVIDTLEIPLGVGGSMKVTGRARNI